MTTHGWEQQIYKTKRRPVASSAPSNMGGSIIHLMICPIKYTTQSIGDILYTIYILFFIIQFTNSNHLRRVSGKLDNLSAFIDIMGQHNWYFILSYICSKPSQKSQWKVGQFLGVCCAVLRTPTCQYESISDRLNLCEEWGVKFTNSQKQENPKVKPIGWKKQDRAVGKGLSSSAFPLPPHWQLYTPLPWLWHNSPLSGHKTSTSDWACWTTEGSNFW